MAKSFDLHFSSNDIVQVLLPKVQVASFMLSADCAEDVLD
jgi:hypothetical protein